MLTRYKTLLQSSLFFFFAFILVATAIAKPGARYNDEYSMELQALKGPDDTEVTITLSTDDPQAYPIPAQLKKAQVKIKDENNDVVFIVNERNVALTDGKVSFTIAGPESHQVLYVKALVDAHPRTAVLQGDVEVLLRPDLVVSEVTAPSEVFVDDPFDVTIILNEVNLESGANATVTLDLDGSSAGTATNVQVNAGGNTAVTFQGISATTAGTVTITATISDAVPGEYDETNNNGSTTIEVQSQSVDAELMQYSFSYSNTDSSRNEDMVDYVNYDVVDYHRVQYQQEEHLSFSANYYGTPPVTFGGTLNLELRLGNEDGVVYSLSEPNHNPSYTGGGTASYNYYEAGGFWLPAVMLYCSVSGSSVYINLFVYSGEWHQYNVDANGNQTLRYIMDEGGPKIHAKEELNVTVLYSDNSGAIGGSFSAPLTQSIYNYEDSGQNWSYSYGPYNYYRANYSERYFGSGSGTLDAPVLDKEQDQQLRSISNVPTEVELAGNYPNPFNPETSIQFTIPEAAPVQLSVYNIQGQQVANLVNGTLDAGYHNVRFSGNDLSSGIYYYVLETSGKRYMEKMTLIK